MQTPRVKATDTRHNAHRRSDRSSGRNQWVTAVAANEAGEIFDLDGFAAVGACGSRLEPLTRANTLVMPHGSELMRLPDRLPILYRIETGRMEILTHNPFSPHEPIFAVAAFNSPGYVLCAVSAYEETAAAGLLPLFSYGAVGWHAGGFRSAVIRVDSEPRQDLRRMPLDKVAAGVKQMRRQLPGNRLRTHLEKCALTYGCPAAKNFFLERYEAPLPTSRHCNARCRGCISLQTDQEISSSQQRIGFTPTPRDIAEVALAHIRKVPHAVVSFGQGCEGDPLMAAEVIAPAIERIRKATRRGTININTNASRPDILKRLIDAGLDSMRVSINSVRPACYTAYFSPRGYRFQDVEESIDLALNHGIFVAANYLNCPGFTDTPEEMAAFIDFLTRHPIHMIQWRNLNYDPGHYLKTMADVSAPGRPVGMRTLLKEIRPRFPRLKFGYFNPPKEKWPSRPR